MRRVRTLAVAVLAAIVAVATVWWVWPLRLEGMTNPAAAAPAIVGGAPADLPRYQWYVSLYTGSPPNVRFKCGGVLVHRKFVLSARHCGLPDYLLLGGQWIRVAPTNITIPRVADGPTMTIHDWMLIELPEPSRMRPITLARVMPTEDSTVTIVGRGNKGSNNADRSLTQAFLKYNDNRNVTFNDTSEFTNQWRQNLAIGRAVAQNSVPNNVCQGDSGGPVFIRGLQLSQDRLLGIVTTGNCDNHVGRRFTYFLKVPRYLDAIIAQKVGVK